MRDMHLVQVTNKFIYMAKSSNKKDESEDQVSSNDILSGFLKENKGDHFNDVVPKSVVISTGSLLLDSMVKVRSGSVLRLCGKGNELGKTSQSFVYARNFMDTMPKSKTIYIKAEGRLTPEIQARSGHTFVNSPAEWSYGTVFVFSSNIFETVAGLIETLLKSMHELGEHLCIIIDSLDGLILKDDLQTKGIDGNMKVAGVPKLTKEMFRRLALPINHYDALMIMLSQYSAAISLDPYSKEPPRQVDASGGSSAGHQSDYVFLYGIRFGGDMILEKPDEKPDMHKNKILGLYAGIEIKKSSTDVTGSRVKIPIKKGRVGSAIWVEKEVVDMLFMFDMIDRKASWLTPRESLTKELTEAGLETIPKLQGLPALYDYMETNKPVFEYLLAKFKKMV
jgi:hypothetical protein